MSDKKECDGCGACEYAAALPDDWSLWWDAERQAMRHACGPCTGLERWNDHLQRRLAAEPPRPKRRRFR